MFVHCNKTSLSYCQKCSDFDC